MKTLIIHPNDPTTDFLSVIYDDTDWTVLREIGSKASLLMAIKDHDHIIMMGHGSPQGLFDILKSRMVIDSTFVFVLRDKQCTCIWCNADEFVQKYKIKGMYTGMVISELEEAINYCVRPEDDEIENSNLKFATAVREALKHIDPVFKFKQMYEGDGEVFEFNRQRFYYE